MAKPATRDNSSLALAIALRAAELGADSVHQRDHAFELGRVLRVWTALRMHVRVRTEKAPEGRSRLEGARVDAGLGEDGQVA